MPRLENASQLQHATRQRCPSILVTPSEALCLRIDRPQVVATHSADVTFLWRCVFPEHKHWFPAFFVELLEQNQGSLVQSQASLLIAVHNVQCILPPICRDVIFLKRNRKDLVTRVVNGNAEGLEYFDLRVRGWCGRRRIGCGGIHRAATGQRRVAIVGIGCWRGIVSHRS